MYEQRDIHTYIHLVRVGRYVVLSCLVLHVIVLHGRVSCAVCVLAYCMYCTVWYYIVILLYGAVLHLHLLALGSSACHVVPSCVYVCM